jgi:ADP-ribose pyrophosphatase YjhB (NUDIX family)
LQQGVVREVLEETGLIVVPGGIIEILDRITPDEASGRVRYHYVLVDFVCHATGGTLCCASDAAEVRWVEHGQLQSGYQLAPVTMAVIDKAFRVSVVGDPPA